MEITFLNSVSSQTRYSLFELICCYYFDQHFVFSHTRIPHWSLVLKVLQVQFFKIQNNYLIEQNFVGQKCRNFSLVAKILSDEIFCLLKILSNISIQKSSKNRTKLSKFWLCVENFVRRNILSVKNFVR